MWEFLGFIKDCSKEHTAIRAKILRKTAGTFGRRHVNINFRGYLVCRFFLSCGQPYDNHVRSKQAADLKSQYTVALWLDSVRILIYEQNTAAMTCLKYTSHRFITTQRCMSLNVTWFCVRHVSSVCRKRRKKKNRGWGVSLIVVTTVTLNFVNICWKFKVRTRRRRYGNLVRLVVLAFKRDSEPGEKKVGGK